MAEMNDLGKIAIARTMQKELQGVGRIIAICDAPTYIIQQRNGQKFTWRQDLCIFPDPDCPKCRGRGFVLPEPVGDWEKDLTPVYCPNCVRSSR